MRTQLPQIVDICDNMMSDMRVEGVTMLTRLVDTFIRAKPDLGCEIVKPLLIRIFE